jgi:hypothetical protein
MALRIGDAVERGFVDNRQKGRVVGKLWLRGRARPLQLDLTGNAHPDLAGRRVHFRRSSPAIAMTGLEQLPDVQRGHAGDLTARREVQVPALPLEALLRWPEPVDPAPSRPAHCLYLEWFSPDTGRVVVQLVDFVLRRSRAVWQPSQEDEFERVQQVEAAWQRYLAQWDTLIEFLDGTVKDPEEKWDEYDYERFLQVCEARGEKYSDLLEKYGDSPEAEARIALAMGWEEDPSASGPPEDLSDAEEDEPLPQPDPSREGKDWIRTPEGDILHPLEQRWMELGRRVERALQAQLGHDGFLRQPEVLALLVQFRLTSGRLSGALRGVALGEPGLEAGLVVACLKRALHSLHDTHRFFRHSVALAAFPTASAKRLERELFEIREVILRLMQEYRQR